MRSDSKVNELRALKRIGKSMVARRGIKIVGITICAGLTLSLAACLRSEISDSARATESRPTTAPSPAPAADYFPAQFRNAAKGSAPEEHIQAF